MVSVHEASLPGMNSQVGLEHAATEHAHCLSEVWVPSSVTTASGSQVDHAAHEPSMPPFAFQDPSLHVYVRSLEAVPGSFSTTVASFERSVQAVHSVITSCSHDSWLPTVYVHSVVASAQVYGVFRSVSAAANVQPVGAGAVKYPTSHSQTLSDVVVDA